MRQIWGYRTWNRARRSSSTPESDGVSSVHLDDDPHNVLTESLSALWLCLVSVFFAGLLLTMIIMESFEEVLAANVELSFFVPLIVGHAGNTGSQAVSTVIRALAVGEAFLSGVCAPVKFSFALSAERFREQMVSPEASKRVQI